MTNLSRVLRTVLVVLSLIMVAGDLAASQWEFTIVAEEGATIVPGTVTTYTWLDPPAYNSGRVVFYGNHPSSFEGVWEWRDGVLSPVVSSADLSFRGLPDVAGSIRTFSANGTLYTRDGAGPFVTVANTSTPIPGGTGNFQSFRWVSTDGSSVVFTANGPSNGTPTGVYSAPVGGGAPVKIANLSDGFSDFFNPVSVSSGNLVFLANDAQGNTGVYRAAVNGSNRMTVIDHNTPIPLPGILGNFNEVSLDDVAPAISGDTALVYGAGAGIWGIFRKQGAGPLQPVITNNTVPPGAQDTFSNIQGMAISGENVAFIGSGVAGSDIPWGVFAVLNGQLEKVIDIAQTIGGRPFRNIRILPRGFDGTGIAFLAFLDDTDVDAVILARCTSCASIFSNGFESGNRSGWSSATP